MNARIDAQELALRLADPVWRLDNLYWILVKSEQPGDEGRRVKFKMNRAQRRFVERLWHRNIILKARQLGFTTLICILWLDYALFNADARCGIIAQDKESAEAIFRDKVRFAYENLPESLRRAIPLKRDSASELLFANNSSIRVATSMRSGTIHRLHVSEFGKICAKYPDKAAEVVTGSLPTVPTDGIVIIESTAEGRDGAFYDMTQLAQAKHLQQHKLGPKDFRFHFYPWWEAPEYDIDPAGVVISSEDHAYFDQIEALMRCKIHLGQRAWYVSQRENDFAGRDEKMWQEYPSTPDEAFQVSTAGAYYAKDMAKLRKRGGIRNVPELDVPVHTFWDIGNSDGCGIWFMQRIKGEDRFIHYHEAHGESLRYYAQYLKDAGYIFGRHFLPHDAAHRRLSDTNKSTEDMLNDLGIKPTTIVPIITDLQTGIQMVRKVLRGVFIDEVGCKEGIEKLDGYRKRFNRATGQYIDEPDKSNGCSEGADAFRQYAQALEAGLIPDAGAVDEPRPEPPPPPDWRL